jgi:hypothetical protein
MLFYALAMMAGGAIWGFAAGLPVGYGLFKLLHWWGLIGNYANSPNWTIVIVTCIGVVAGLVLAAYGLWEERRWRSRQPNWWAVEGDVSNTRPRRFRITRARDR